MTSTYRDQSADLSRLAAAARLRALQDDSGTDFSSNDYLGLGASGLLAEAAREALDRGVPVGSGGSRLLRGNHAEHEVLEAEAAEFFGSESALWFATGYAANSALLATLPQRGDLVVYDELVHASAHEGMRLSRADIAPAEHAQCDSFEASIRAYRASGGKGKVWIAVESLYSMDGDRAPLDDLMQLADRYDGVLLIDEAHATGVFGEDGRGLAGHLGNRENVIALRTCGKAMGCEGALVCASEVVKQFLINRARGFIFSTAPSPLMAAVVRASLRLLSDHPELRDDLWAHVRHAERVLAPVGVARTGSQILPLIIGPDDRTMAIAAAVRAKGFDVRGIRPPTVPDGTARLRISITRNAAPDAIDGLAAALAEALAVPATAG